jgi:hypothetical protein
MSVICNVKGKREKKNWPKFGIGEGGSSLFKGLFFLVVRVIDYKRGIQ